MALSWALYQLSKTPEVADRLRKEFADAFGDGPVDPEKLDWDNVRGLTYLDAVCKEVLRLYPPAAMTLRIVTENTTIPTSEGNTISVPKGTVIPIIIYAIHRLERFWGDDAAEFKPERWLEPRASQDQEKFPKRVIQQRFMPFLSGERGCIGNQFALNEFKVLSLGFS